MSDLTGVVVPHSPDLILNDNIFCNEHGYVRLGLVQCAMGLHRYAHDVVKGDRLVYMKDTRLDRHLSDDDLCTIVEQCVKWRDQREVIPIRRTWADQVEHFGSEADIPSGSTVTSVFDGNGVHHWKDKYDLDCSYWKGVWFDWAERYDFSLMVTPKRGNDIYVGIVKERFAPALGAENIVFFDPAWGTKQTNMLYITVTTDPAVVGSDIGKAWLLFGNWWNSFITNLRQQYGDISYIRTWQSQDNYMPHAHALVYFNDKTFNVVQWRDKNGDISFRLPSRSHDRSAIKTAWKWGNCDIQCVGDTQTAYKDLLKYVLRDLEGGASDKTNGMVWFFEKRSFAISGSFFDIIKGASSEPELADLINADSDNSNSPLVRIDIFPVMGADLVPKTWQQRLIGEDPPPDLVNLFAGLEAQYEPHLSKKGLIEKYPNCKIYVWRKPEGWHK